MPIRKHWEKLFEQQAGLYGNSYLSAGYSNRRHFFYEQRNILDWINEDSGPLILDVGCNTGVFSKPLSDKNRMIGLDAASGPLIYARLNGLLPVQADICNLPFRNESFDLVMCINMIQCIDNPEPALYGLMRIVKQGGYIIILTLNAQSIARKIYTFVDRQKNFITHYRIKKLAAFFKKNNFKDIEIMYEFYPLRLRKVSKTENYFFDILATSFAIKAKK